MPLQNDTSSLQPQRLSRGSVPYSQIFSPRFSFHVSFPFSLLNTLRLWAVSKDKRRVNVAQVEETRALRDAGRTAQKCPKRHWSMWRETASTRCSGSLPSQVFHWFCLHSTFKLLPGLDACKDSIYSLCLLRQRCFFIYSELWDSYHSSFSCLTSEAVQE